VIIGIGAQITTAQPGARQSGIHQYARELIAHLPEAIGEHSAVAFAAAGTIEKPASTRVSMEYLRLPVERASVRIAWEQTALPVHLRRHHVDLYHGLAFAMPRFPQSPTIVTFHDLAFLRWPDLVPTRRAAYLTRAVRHSARAARRFIAVSEHTRREMVDLLALDPDRIDVTPLGVDLSFAPKDESAVTRFRDQTGLTHPFVLAVGNLEPRKNLESLVRAFGDIAPEFPHHLVLLGAEGWKTQALHQAIRSSPASDRIHLPGFVRPQHLPLWYTACDLFVIPSVDEGFGLTLLEAMACGAPAVAARAGALPETAGDAAMLVEPDSESLGIAIASLLANDSAREVLSRRGPLRAAQFTWSRTAALTVAAYERACQ
jgi:glycosyltransferase involved in cell wall biosynthesis